MVPEYRFLADSRRVSWGEVIERRRWEEV